MNRRRHKNRTHDLAVCFGMALYVLWAVFTSTLAGLGAMEAISDRSSQIVIGILTASSAAIFTVIGLVVLDRVDTRSR